MPRRRLPGLSPNPSTNRFVTDVALRGAARMARGMAEKAITPSRTDPKTGKQIIDERSIFQTLVTVAIARVATRSVPGAVIVGGGIIAKALYDRGKQRREAREEEQQAEPEGVEPAEK